MEQTVNITYWLGELRKATPVIGYENIDKDINTSIVTHNRYNPHFYKSRELVHYDTVEVFVDRMARALNLKAQDREQQLRADLEKAETRYQELSQQYDAKVNRLASVGIDLTDCRHRLALCREALSGETLASFQLKKENAELREAAAELKRELRAVKEQYRIQSNNIRYLRDAIGKSIPDTRRAVQAKPETRSSKPETFGVQPHSVGSTYPLIVVGGVDKCQDGTENVWWVRFGDLSSFRYSQQWTAEMLANMFATLIKVEGWDEAKAYFAKVYADNSRSVA